MPFCDNAVNSLSEKHLYYYLFDTTIHWTSFLYFTLPNISFNLLLYNNPPMDTSGQNEGELRDVRFQSPVQGEEQQNE